MKFIFTLLLTLFTTLSLQATTLATVNSEAVTLNDIQTILKSYEDIPHYAQLSTEDKEFVLHQAIDAKLILQEAKKEKIQTTPLYKEALKSIEEKLMVELWMKKHLESIVITQEEVKNSYYSNMNDYAQPLQLKARHIVVQTYNEAKNIIDQLEATKDDIQKKFIALANEKSIEPNANTRGGDLGWFKQGEMLEEFWQEALTLEENHFSQQPLKSDYGYHVIFLEGKQEPYTLKLEQIYSTIENKLKMNRFQNSIAQKLNTIRKNSKILIHK